MGLEPRRRGDGGQPGGVRLERPEEPLDPATLAPAMLPGRRPGTELLAVVAHRPDPRAVLGGVLAQVVDDLLDVAERDPVAQALLGPEDAQELALVLRRVRAPQVLLRDRRRAEVGVVEDRPVVAGGDQRGRQVRFPDALGQPGPGRPPSEQTLDPSACGRAATIRSRPGARRGPARSSRRRRSRPGRARPAQRAGR